MVSLHGKNAAAAAKIVKSHDIHILLDLNGHTLHSGLGIMGFRPAPVQVSVLSLLMMELAISIVVIVLDVISWISNDDRCPFH
jgi:predicted O-linked N-acetylglucosamine transferase (SPINDLY family)